MRRKLLKYAKFILCSMIIFSLMMPSFATSVDSNAFVTKEEVDKALSDFNKRLVAFEAGINSKIDTQVTSYLDRNGIWNAQDQVFETDYKCTTNYNTTINKMTSKLFDCMSEEMHDRWVFPNTSSGGENNIGWFGIFCSSPKTQYLKIPDMKYLYASKRVVENVTETGLCMCRLTFGFNIDYDNRRSSCYLAFSGSKPSTVNEKWATMSHMMTQENRETTEFDSPSSSSSSATVINPYVALPDDAFGNTLFSYAEWTAVDDSAKYKVFAPPIGTFTFMGFVKKNMPLYYAVALIGAKDKTVDVRVESKHVISWHIVDADIKVY